MKSLIANFVLLVGLSLCLSRCGVHIGNGMVSYENPNGYSVQYQKGLSLSENADKTIARIDNSPMAMKTTEVSSTTFKVDTSVDVTSVGDLHLAATRLGTPPADLKDVTLNGFAGLGWTAESAGVKTAKYYLMTTTKKLLEVTVQAFQSGNGFGLISPIIQTFTGGVPLPNLARGIVAVQTKVVDWELGKNNMKMKVQLELSSGLVVTEKTGVRYRISASGERGAPWFLLSAVDAHFFEGRDEVDFDRTKHIFLHDEAVDGKTGKGVPYYRGQAWEPVAGEDKDLYYLYDCKPLRLLGRLRVIKGDRADQRLQTVAENLACEATPQEVAPPQEPKIDPEAL